MVVMGNVGLFIIIIGILYQNKKQTFISNTKKKRKIHAPRE